MTVLTKDEWINLTPQDLLKELSKTGISFDISNCSIKKEIDEYNQPKLVIKGKIDVNVIYDQARKEERQKVLGEMDKIIGIIDREERRQAFVKLRQQIKEMR